ncbi:barstar family protein [Serinicoccus kebangsaanensis]|uniref:barstar family protein n=1 Tax=Serinicoccus kebangsaanensis TaxID=2602069 RepID=UPI00124EB0DA|nr:barstar family protein [Serinicoccus kebangsaanensis]
MIILAAERADDARAHFAQAGYAVAEVSTPVGGGLREMQAQVAQALRLPRTAALNLDALVDSLRDLAQSWGGQEVALLWEDAGLFAETEGRAWWILSEILDDADSLAVVALGPRRAAGGDQS